MTQKVCTAPFARTQYQHTCPGEQRRALPPILDVCGASGYISIVPYILFYSIMHAVPHQLHNLKVVLLKNNQEKCPASSLYLPLSSEVPPCACSIRHAKILVLIIIFSLRRQGVQRDHKWVLACILSVIENYLRNAKLGSWSVSCNFETCTGSSEAKNC